MSESYLLLVSGYSLNVSKKKCGCNRVVLLLDYLYIFYRDRTQTSSVNQSVVRAVVNSLVVVEQNCPASKTQLVLYKSVFEAEFLRTTGEYYRQKASEYISELSCCDYLEKVG